MASTAALFPVVLMIACGWLAAKIGWIRASSLPDLIKVVFYILIPSLMFRSMSQVGFSGLDYYPIAIYLGVALLVFLGVAFFLGRSQRGFVIGLACIFSNHVMIGIPLITLAYGHEALVTLITLISIHALVLLSFATLLLEWNLAKSALQSEAGGEKSKKVVLYQTVKIIGKTIYGAVTHPVILPIFFGLMWSLTKWPLPTFVDKALMTLGQANGAMSLILVGATLAHTKLKGELRNAFFISMVKNVLFPALVFSAAWLLGLRGVPLAVITVVAGLPIGNNVYLFSVRYKQAQELTTASMAMTTVFSIVTLSLIMGALAKWVL